MNTLSLFDGISCGQLALKNLNIIPSKYLASEIDKHAISVTTHNFPNTIQLGDINNININELPQITLLIGGSPCQGFSYAGKQLNFNDPRSKLLFNYINILNTIKPKYFLLENVYMKQSWQDTISNLINTKPININSNLVSAQTRNRLYWTNIPVKELPKNKNISWHDIAEDNFFAGAIRGRRLNQYLKRDDYNKNIPIIQYIESRQDNKTNCLSTVQKDNIASKYNVIRSPAKNMEWRYLTRNESERLQTIPDNYTSPVSSSQAAKLLGNAWTVDVISHILSFME